MSITKQTKLICPTCSPRPPGPLRIYKPGEREVQIIEAILVDVDPNEHAGLIRMWQVNCSKCEYTELRAIDD